MLASRQGAGVFVTALDPDQSWEAVWQQADIVEVIEGRIAIETQAATLAALRREPRDLRSIRRALAARLGHDEREGHVDADMHFHRTVVAAAQNTVMAEIETHPRTEGQTFCTVIVQDASPVRSKWVTG